eukprot:690554-Amphidinium_carterae.1
MHARAGTTLTSCVDERGILMLGAIQVKTKSCSLAQAVAPTRFVRSGAHALSRISRALQCLHPRHGVGLIWRSGPLSQLQPLEFGKMQCVHAMSNDLHCVRHKQTNQQDQFNKGKLFLVRGWPLLSCVYMFYGIYAGIVFTLEVLGEVPDWEDKFYITANGDAISPFQSFYWM